MNEQRNVLGTWLAPCSSDPLTGALRDGCCTSVAGDVGLHLVCAIVTEEFLAFSQARGNDLVTPVPQYSFPGLKPGDRWCLCASRWEEARLAGCAPTVVLEATNEAVLSVLALEELKAHALN